MQNIISNKTIIHSFIMFYYDFLFPLLIFILLFQIKNKLGFYSQHSSNGNLYFWPYQSLMDHNSVQQTSVDIFERNWNYPRINNKTNKFLSHWIKILRQTHYKFSGLKSGIKKKKKVYLQQIYVLELIYW